MQSPPRISSLSFFHYLSLKRPLNLTPAARSGCGLYSLVKRKICTPKFDVFSFVLRTRGTPSLAPLDPKMQKIIVYKTAYVTWCWFSLVVVNLGFPCLYFALSLGVRQSRFASLLLPSLALSLPRCLYCPHAVSTRTSHILCPHGMPL